MTRLDRRSFMVTLSASLVARAHAEEAWPHRAVVLVHGFPAGGPVDTVARIVAEGLTVRIGQQVIVESRPGATGTTAAAQVARAAPDGYTLSIIPATYAAAAAMRKQLPYRPIDDFTMIGMISDYPLVIVTHSEYPFRSIADVIKTAASQTRPLAFGSPGVGSLPHLLGELLMRKAKIHLQHVPYRGGVPALADLLGKHIDLIIDPPSAPLAKIRDGTLRALAVSSAQRFFLLPDVSTLAESGVPDIDVTSWCGLVGPAGMPEAVVARLNADMARLLGETPVIERLHAAGMVAKTSSAAEFKMRVAGDVAKWASVIADANMERI
jgi:tripartite-type tricarboxylate transporter receptor subunit TctC